MRTRVYVDGYNLYYGCLKGTPFKWLDLQTLFRDRILPSSSPTPAELIGIKYFTAPILERAARALDSVSSQSRYMGTYSTPIRINASRHDSRQEPYAVAPHVRICAGGAESNLRPYRDRWSSPPMRFRAERLMAVPYERAALDTEVLLKQVDGQLHSSDISALDKKHPKFLRDRLFAHRARCQLSLFPDEPSVSGPAASH